MTAHVHPELAKARELDIAGNFDEAINCLARGTQAGDLQCMAVLGQRLFTGDRAPTLPAEGLQFLGEAFEKGNAAAGNRIAALTALGVRAPPNWSLGREWLVKAAMKGSAPAQKQLLVLCDDRALAARAADMKDPPWKQLAAAIDLEAWCRSPPATHLSENPRVSIFPGFLRPELCEVLIGFADGHLEPALVYDANNRKDIVDVHRNNTLARFGMDSVEFAHVLVQARMAAACGLPILHFEAPTELHYSPGEQITDHFDFVDPHTTQDYAGEIARNGQRYITFIVYLNEDYDAGETAFPNLGLSHKGHCGEGIYFVNVLPDLSPDLRMLHVGRPTTRGEKWIITQFIRSRPTRAAA
jgi:prolyl 4-hydroxylase